eukprot:21052-Heterococcus_DN1.PRE.2
MAQVFTSPAMKESEEVSKQYQQPFVLLPARCWWLCGHASSVASAESIVASCEAASKQAGSQFMFAARVPKSRLASAEPFASAD